MTMWFYTDTLNEDDNHFGVWDSNSTTFYKIFNRVAYYFRHFEVDYQKACFNEDYIDQGLWESELNLTKVSKEAFNVFYLRTKEALDNFPDFWDISGSEKFIISTFEEIIGLLEKDNRYDPEWIRKYQMEMIRKKCIS